MVSGKVYSKQIDIWSIGCILYEICTMYPAFSGTKIQLKERIQDKNYMPKLINNIDPKLQEIVRMILNRDPAKRPSIEQILAIPNVRKHQFRVASRHHKLLDTEPIIVRKYPDGNRVCNNNGNPK